MAGGDQPGAVPAVGSYGAAYGVMLLALVGAGAAALAARYRKAGLA